MAVELVPKTIPNSFDDIRGYTSELRRSTLSTRIRKNERRRDNLWKTEKLKSIDPSYKSSSIDCETDGAYW